MRHRAKACWRPSRVPSPTPYPTPGRTKWSTRPRRPFGTRRPLGSRTRSSRCRITTPTVRTGRWYCLGTRRVRTCWRIHLLEPMSLVNSGRRLIQILGIIVCASHPAATLLNSNVDATQLRQSSYSEIKPVCPGRVLLLKALTVPLHVTRHQ